MQREQPATKASLPALFQAALVCPQRAPTKGVRRQQKGKGKKPKECAGSRKGERKKKGRTGGPRQSFSAENCALQVLERCSRPHSFAPHSERQQKECEQAERAGRDRASALKAVASSGVVAPDPLSTREGPGSIPGLSMPMCACVWHRTNQRSAPAACSICSKAIGPEGAASHKSFASRTGSRPHSFVHSEHQPKGVRRHQQERKEAEQRGKLCPAGN